MRSLYILLIATAIISSCKDKEADSEVKVKGQSLVTLPIAPDKVKGTYSGDFKGSPIAITLNYVSDNHASGYNVHKGLTRNIAGTIEAKEGGLHLLLSEPGTNDYDGKFDLTIDTAKWTAKGSWKPFKKGDETTLSLKRQSVPTDENQYGTTLMDTLGNYIILKPDGSCTYNYLTDTTNTGQQLTVRGNYTKDKNTVTVFWQKNEAFPSQKSVFKWIEKKPYPDEDYTEKSMKGEGRLFTEMND